ncbi:MAG: endo-1,4-beta-xylanase [Planctomycetota bacterium]
MLSFLVFEGDTPAEALTLRHECLVGPEEVPVAGDVSFEQGLARCAKTNSDAASLSLQVTLDAKSLALLDAHAIGEDAPLDANQLQERLNADRAERARLSPGRAAGEATPQQTAEANGFSALSPLGVLTLRTCLLPERERPYLLSLELARHRLMLFLNKLEEWQLFDLPPDHPILELFEQARLIFTEALVVQRNTDTDPAGVPDVSHGYSPEAHRLATRALWLAVEASERLAIEHAARDFGPRVSGQIYTELVERTPSGHPGRARANTPVLSPDRPGIVLPQRPVLGSVISPSSFSPAAQTVASQTLDFVQMPMRWIEMEPTEGKYSFKRTDQWIEWAVRKARLPVFAGPVIDFRSACVPEWLYIWENDYETLRELVYEHLRNLVTRYRRTISRWTVMSGIHVNDNFHFNFDQMMDLTRVCVQVGRKLHPTAKIFVELSQPWGEYYTRNRRSLPPILYAEMVSQAGISVDGFSVRVQMGQPEHGQSARDLMSFSAMLDRYAVLEKPIALTIGVPSDTPESTNAPELADRQPGFWRGDWSPEQQADWATAVAGIALAKPFVQSVAWHELYDVPQPAEMPRGGLIDVQGQPKPAVSRMSELRDALKNSAVPPRLRDAALLDRGGRG